MSRSDAALRVSGMTIAYRTDGDGRKVVVRDASVTIAPGEVVGLAGESGSGKSTLALAAIGYSSPGAVILDGTAHLGDRDVYGLPIAERRRLWGGEIGFVAQSATAAFNPARRIDQQLGEVLTIHEGLRGEAARARQIELLDRVGIPEPSQALKRYPHEFSGGQLQRIAIATAVACHPAILILDEPTTGLDVQTQKQITALLHGLVQEQGMGALYVSHNLALLYEVSQRLYVMYAGEIVEAGSSDRLLRRPRHPYTRALIDSVPSTEVPIQPVGIPGLPPGSVVEVGCAFADRCAFAEAECRVSRLELVELPEGRLTRCRRHDELSLAPVQPPLLVTDRAAEPERPALTIEAVSYRYRQDGPAAVNAVSLSVARGESLGIVGESGSGKSTLLRLASGLLEPSEGRVLLGGDELSARVDRRSRDQKRRMQLIFQDPDSSLNPAHTVADILRRPLRLFQRLPRGGEQAAIAELLAMVNLPEEIAYRYPDELSGGQKQRVAIARAFGAKPEVLLCDEITSALDVSVQATIVALLEELARAQGVAVVFVSHDLALVRAVTTKIAVMRRGEICELGTAKDIFEHPSADYTKSLLEAIPDLPRNDDRPDLALPAASIEINRNA